MVGNNPFIPLSDSFNQTKPYLVVDNPFSTLANPFIQTNDYNSFNNYSIVIIIDLFRLYIHLNVSTQTLQVAGPVSTAAQQNVGV